MKKTVPRDEWNKLVCTLREQPEKLLVSRGKNDNFDFKVIIGRVVIDHYFVSNFGQQLVGFRNSRSIMYCVEITHSGGWVTGFAWLL